MFQRYANFTKIISLLVISLLSAYAGHWVTNSHWQAKWSAHESADAKANEKAAVEMLTKQQKLLQELEHAYKKQKNLQEKHDRNVADSRIASDRLRSELNRIKTMPQITHTSTIAERANAATDRLLLAELLGISDSRAGIYAEEADRLRIALGACNDEFNAVRAVR